MELEEIHNLLDLYKFEGSSLITSIGRLRSHLNISLAEAKDIVINSPTWISHKNNFNAWKDELNKVLEQESDEIIVGDSGKVEYITRLNRNT